MLYCRRALVAFQAVDTGDKSVQLRLGDSLCLLSLMGELLW